MTRRAERDRPAGHVDLRGRADQPQHACARRDHTRSTTCLSRRRNRPRSASACAVAVFVPSAVTVRPVPPLIVPSNSAVDAALDPRQRQRRADRQARSRHRRRSSPPVPRSYRSPSRSSARRCRCARRSRQTPSQGRPFRCAPATKRSTRRSGRRGSSPTCALSRVFVPVAVTVRELAPVTPPSTSATVCPLSSASALKTVADPSRPPRATIGVRGRRVLVGRSGAHRR